MRWWSPWCRSAFPGPQDGLTLHAGKRGPVGEQHLPEVVDLDRIGVVDPIAGWTEVDHAPGGPVHGVGCPKECVDRTPVAVGQDSRRAAAHLAHAVYAVPRAPVRGEYRCIADEIAEIGQDVAGRGRLGVSHRSKRQYSGDLLQILAEAADPRSAVMSDPPQVRSISAQREPRRAPQARPIETQQSGTTRCHTAKATRLLPRRAATATRSDAAVRTGAALATAAALFSASTPFAKVSVLTAHFNCVPRFSMYFLRPPTLEFSMCWHDGSAADSELSQSERCR